MEKAKFQYASISLARMEQHDNAKSFLSSFLCSLPSTTHPKKNKRKVLSSGGTKYVSWTGRPSRWTFLHRGSPSEGLFLNVPPLTGSQLSSRVISQTHRNNHHHHNHRGQSENVGLFGGSKRLLPKAQDGPNTVS